MGAIKDWAAQSAGFPSDTYAKQVLFPWAALLNNVDPDKPGLAFSDYSTINGETVFSLVEEAMLQGSPYENVTAYNPDTIISDIRAALDDLRDTIADYDEDTLNDAVTQAADRVDELMGTDNIPDLVDLFRERHDLAYNRDVSNVYAGLWEAGAIVGTQTFAAAALLKAEHDREVSEYEKNLQLTRQSQRTQLVGQLLQMAVNTALQKAQMRQSLVGTSLDYLKFVTTAKQDQQDKDLEYLTKHIAYDLDLMQYATNALGAIYGAQQVPRQQTKGERLLAAINTSISAGIQGGLALGSPAAGLGMAGLNLLAQLALGQ